MGTMRQQALEEQSRIPDSAPPVSAALPAVDERRQAILTSTVESQVIPQLLLKRRAESDFPIPQSTLTELAEHVLSRDSARAHELVEHVRTAGCPVEVIYLDLLAPVARTLGQMWVDDDCDFTDVTVGLFMLQAELRRLSDQCWEIAGPGTDAMRILLLPLPREQHTFGLTMVHDFFRLAGWDAVLASVDTEEQLFAIVRDSAFDIVGFSLACDEQLDETRALIKRVRKASCNPSLRVMVGGPGFAANPALAESIGADGTATDGKQAVRAAERLVNLSGRRCS